MAASIGLYYVYRYIDIDIDIDVCVRLCVRVSVCHELFYFGQVVHYAKKEKVAASVGLYYMSNALGIYINSLIQIIIVSPLLSGCPLCQERKGCGERRALLHVQRARAARWHAGVGTPLLVRGRGTRSYIFLYIQRVLCICI